VGLAGEEDLYRPVRIVQQGLQPVRLGEQERGPLVGSKAPGEADGEHAGVEDVVAPREVALADALLHP
jgi:hypothetical protein